MTNIEISPHKKIIYWLIATLGILLLLEIACSLFFLFRPPYVTGALLRPFSASYFYKKQSTDIMRIRWDYSTNKMLPGTFNRKVPDTSPQKQHTYTINSLGFRGREFDPVNKNGVRIISAGGSTTLGINSPDEKTYPYLLEEGLRETGLSCEVLNFGFGSKGLNFLRPLIFNEAVQYKPDVITVYSNRNSAFYDSNDQYRKFDTIDNELGLELLKAHLLLNRNVSLYRFLFKLYEKAREKIGKTGQSDGQIYFPFTKSFTAKKEYFERGYRNTLETIIRLGKKHDFKIILIKQPHVVDIKVQLDLLNMRVDELLSQLSEFHKLNIDGRNDWDKWRMLTNALLNKQLDILKIQFPEILVVDPMEYFLIEDYHQLFFPDGLHLKPKGNKLLSDVILKSIVDNKFIDLPSTRN